MRTIYRAHWVRVEHNGATRKTTLILQDETKSPVEVELHLGAAKTISMELEKILCSSKATRS